LDDLGINGLIQALAAVYTTSTVPAAQQRSALPIREEAPRFRVISPSTLRLIAGSIDLVLERESHRITTNAVGSSTWTAAVRGDVNALPDDAPSIPKIRYCSGKRDQWSGLGRRKGLRRVAIVRIEEGGFGRAGASN